MDGRLSNEGAHGRAGRVDWGVGGDDRSLLSESSTGGKIGGRRFIAVRSFGVEMRNFYRTLTPEQFDATVTIHADGSYTYSYDGVLILGSFTQRYVKRHGFMRKIAEPLRLRGFVPPFERAILGRFLGWDADRIPELFIGEVVIPEQVDVLP
jgi:hypothetical protein